MTATFLKELLLELIRWERSTTENSAWITFKLMVLNWVLEVALGGFGWEGQPEHRKGWGSPESGEGRPVGEWRWQCLGEAGSGLVLVLFGGGCPVASATVVLHPSF